MSFNNGVLTANIANGASLSQALSLGSKRLFGLQMPATWTAADLTFQGSADGVTWNDLYDSEDAEVTVDAAAARYIALTNTDACLFLGIRWLKIRSGTTGAAVNQGGARAITVIMVD